VRACAGREIIAGLRAEAISFGPGSGIGERRTLHARVEVTEPTGADTLAVLMVGGQEMTARLQPDFPLRAGEQGEFGIDLGKLVFFDPESGKRIR
jgi:multiple sugar transport system ATP-binding protein